MRTLRNKLQQANQRLQRHYPEPSLTYQQRGTSAGTAWLQSWEIRLNPVLLLENKQPFIDEVVPHELAHLLVWKYFGHAAPHGTEWKWMMAVILDVAPKRTHQFEIQSVRDHRYVYRCRCQQHLLTIRRHNRIVRGSSVFHCLRCGDVLLREEAVSSENGLAE